MASDLIGNATIGLMEHLSHYGRGWKLKGRDSEFPVVNPICSRPRTCQWRTISELATNRPEDLPVEELSNEVQVTGI
jgi:hypothetical protein